MEEIKLDPLWIKVATKFVKDEGLYIVVPTPIPKEEKQETLKLNGPLF